MRQTSASRAHPALPKDVDTSSPARPPEYVVNRTAVVAVAILAPLIALGTLAGGVWKSAPREEVAHDPVVRLAAVRETASTPPRPTAAPAIVDDEPRETFRTRTLRAIRPVRHTESGDAPADPWQTARRAAALAVEGWNLFAEEAADARRSHADLGFLPLQFQSEAQLRLD